MTDLRAHRYTVQCSWRGSTSGGYQSYSRTHRVTAAPVAPGLELSADPAFLGDSEQLNPEQLLLIAASSCQLLSFLAVAARARIDVIAYQDDAEAVMPPDDRPVRITDIWLRPRITVRAPATEDRVRHLTAVAHRECFIANSLRSRIVVEPVVTVVKPDSPS
ncbi:MAG: OsmC family protein [Pseudonocardiales bacterium]